MEIEKCRNCNKSKAVYYGYHGCTCETFVCTINKDKEYFEVPKEYCKFEQKSVLSICKIFDFLKC